MADVEPGRVLGDRFEIVGVLGHGGMATVFLARDRLRDEAVALKVLHGHLAKSASWRSRLRREVHAASRLRHPHALVASDLHELDGTLAVSMPLHPGRTIAEHVERHGPMTGPALERVAKQLSSALREAHGAGLVHRDVTPTNVMVDDAGDAALTDFGLARFTDQRTATGTGVLGTAGYAAPEVYKGVRGDPRSDLYGLGAVLYQAATGMAPFAAPDPVAVLQKQLADERIPLRKARPDLPPHLAELIDRMLAPDPEGRPQAAAEVLDSLERREAPIVAPPRMTTHAKGPIGPPRATHLPHGGWSVVVSERRRDRDRRRAVRAWAERQRSADLGADVERALGEVKRRVMGLMKIDPGRSPEDHLSDAVAREAGLPPAALTVPAGMLQRRFRLVESVSEESARRLAEAAEDNGFRAVPWRPGAPAPRSPRGPARFLLVVLSVLALLFGVGLVNEVVPGTPLESVVAWVTEMPFLVFFVFIPFWRFLAPSWDGPGDERLPVAFGKDLRFHLAPNADVTLPPPEPDEEVHQAPPAARLPSAHKEPAGPKAPVSRHTVVIERARAQLAAFDEALATSDRLPEAAVRDLHGTSADLRERVEALATRVLALEQEVGKLDDTAAASAVDRVEARLERLHTLARAGRSGESAEIASLEQALATHRAVLDRAEALESQLTLAVARLLETGASAAHARIELVDAVEPGRSADDLLARLRVQTEGARRALAELEGPSSPAPGPLPRDPLPTGDARPRAPLRDRA